MPHRKWLFILAADVFHPRRKRCGMDLNDEQQETYDTFNDRVNMTPKELEDWLETDDSKRVGQTEEGEDESKGHRSGRRILEIKQKKKADLDEDDLDHMKRVNSYVARHSAQGPEDDKEHSDWRYSLMNWGHDPLK